MKSGEREFDDEVYEKINQALKAVEDGDYCSIEEFESEMEKEYPFLKANKKILKSKIIAEKNERYYAYGKRI